MRFCFGRCERTSTRLYVEPFISMRAWHSQMHSKYKWIKGVCTAPPHLKIPIGVGGGGGRPDIFTKSTFNIHFDVGTLRPQPLGVPIQCTVYPVLCNGVINSRGLYTKMFVTPPRLPNACRRIVCEWRQSASMTSTVVRIYDAIMQ